VTSNFRYRVMRHRDRPAEEVCHGVIGAAHQWIVDCDQDDDMTVITLKGRKGLNRTPAVKSGSSLCTS